MSKLMGFINADESNSAVLKKNWREKLQRHWNVTAALVLGPILLSCFRLRVDSAFSNGRQLFIAAFTILQTLAKRLRRVLLA